VTVAGARGPGLRAAALALAAAAALFIAGCASGPPKQVNNACRIFAEKSGWEKHTRRAARKWRADAATLLAIMHQPPPAKSRAARRVPQLPSLPRRLERLRPRHPQTQKMAARRRQKSRPTSKPLPRTTATLRV